MGAPVRAVLSRALLGTLLLTGGCAGTSADAAFHDVFWRSARQCEARYRNLRVDRIDPSGELTLAGDLDLRTNLGEFTRCYHEGIAQRVEERRRSGAAISEAVNLTPAVEMD